jgi:DNA-binding CsgD family transcriptional regulator/tetratricopeptide (TPR) repeat protein
MTRFVFILIILFLSLSTKAFQLDSLYDLLSNLEGKPKIDALNKLAGEHPKKKEKLANEALLLAEKINYLKGKTKATELLGEYSFENKAFENAFTFFKKANEGYTTLKDLENQLRSLKKLNQASFNLKRYDEVVDYCLQIQHIAEKVDNKSYLAYAFARLGRIRGQIMNDFQNSRTYSLKAINLYLEIDERDKLSALYSNLGLAYYLDQQYDSTLLYYNKGIEIAKEFQQKDELHILYSVSSELYYQKETFDKALNYSLQALNISLNNEREDLVIFDKLLIGKIYLAKKQYKTALEYVTVGTEKAEASQDLKQTIIGYGLLSKIYKEKNDLSKSIEYLEKISPLKDTLAKSSLSIRLAEKEAEIQMQRKQQELESLEKKATRNRMIRNGVILISALVIFILALFINRYNVIMKFQKQELDRLRTIKQLEEKEKLLLKEKLSHQEKILASNTMHIIQKNKMLADLKSKINKIPAAQNDDNFKAKIKNINRTIDTNMTFENDWQKFKLQFEQVYPYFFSKLYKDYPGLSNNEIRFCSYIKIGHNTKEIAQLMGVNASSVQKARYRLKKKMGLDKSIDLIDFIQTL